MVNFDPKRAAMPAALPPAELVVAERDIGSAERATKDALDLVVFASALTIWRPFLAYSLDAASICCGTGGSF